MNYTMAFGVLGGLDTSLYWCWKDSRKWDEVLGGRVGRGEQGLAL